MNKLDELIQKLEELFELDKTDLDFGIYRLINQRQDRIKDFLHNKRLREKVQTILGQANRSDSEDKLKMSKEKCLSAFGQEAIDDEGNLIEMFQSTPAGKEYLEALRQFQSGNISSQIETEVYSHLLDFFSRYYQDGDFISQRRSAIKDKYAIPYNGEEVVMHWANKDQYYIKSSENLKDYIFTIEKKRIKFRLAGMDAVKDNNKAKRQMLLYNELDGNYDDNGEIIIESDENNLIIPFYFKELKKNLTEKQHLELLETEIPKLLNDAWNDLLLANDITYTGKDSRTVLGKHLLAYIRKQTSDFFIHKDLGGFLKRELDFYIKNEVMYLDDVDNRPAEYLTSEIRKIKAIRAIANQVIDFLAQFENFQKKLWLKKKFIYETNYCITLDRIPAEFYPEIAQNQKQIEEWKQLFTIEEIKGDAIYKSFTDFREGDAETKLVFLRQNPFLVLDTAFFPSEFKYKLLSKIDNLDEQTDGLLIHSENFQALNLLQPRYKEKVKCVYIDPPYNTNASEIAYKNGYKHSSWCTLLNNRLEIAHNFISKNGINFVAIDNEEFFKLEFLLRTICGNDNYITNISIMHNPKGRDQKHFADAHEYLLCYAKSVNDCFTNRLTLSDNELKEKYSREDKIGKFRELPLRRSGSGAQREDRPYMFFPFLFNDDDNNLTVIKPDEYKNLYKNKVFDDEFLEKLKAKYEEMGYKFILPIRDNGSYGRWRWGYENCKETCLSELNPTLIYKGNTIYQIDRAKDTFLPKTFWYGERYDASSKGTNLLKSIVGEILFDYPKSLYAVCDFLQIGANSSSFILDYFAGSGTTGHAVINLNREDEGSRKYILVEMGNYFDTVLKPRIQKVVYSKDWKNGKPVSRESGVSHCFKYLRLESYEDTLNNLMLQDQHPDILGIMLDDEIKDDYLINYMLDIESRDSLMNIKRFENPFDYSIKIFNYETGEAEIKKIDLIETFNYLLGIEVKEFKMMDGFITVEGKNPASETVIIVWRNVQEKDNEALKNFLIDKLRINTADTEFRAIYVNGDHTLNDPHNKIFQIEEVFNDLMFNVEDV